jgi:hypothetical protein
VRDVYVSEATLARGGHPARTTERPTRYMDIHAPP